MTMARYVHRHGCASGADSELPDVEQVFILLTLFLLSFCSLPKRMTTVLDWTKLSVEIPSPQRRAAALQLGNVLGKNCDGSIQDLGLGPQGD